MEIDQTCPWGTLPQGTLRFCEEHLCSWVVAPAETYSNSLYLLVGVLLLLQWRRTPLLEVPKVLGSIAIGVGVFSALYHASHRWITETFDLGSMSFLSAYLLCHALERMGWLSRKRFWVLFGCLVLASWMTLVFIDGPPRLWIFASMIILYVQLEAYLAIRAKRLRQAIRHGPLIWTLGIFVISYALWLMDFYRWGCSPSNHYFSGHAGWHILNAFCFMTLSAYLGQFEGLKGNPPVACAKPPESLR